MRGRKGSMRGSFRVPKNPPSVAVTATRTNQSVAVMKPKVETKMVRGEEWRGREGVEGEGRSGGGGWGWRGEEWRGRVGMEAGGGGIEEGITVLENSCGEKYNLL